MLITLDPPYRLQAADTSFVFKGWAQVLDPEAPDIRLHINGVETPVVVTHRPPLLSELFPGIEALQFYAQVDFAEVLRGADPQEVREPFLLRATLSTDGVPRTFEYAVTEAWLTHVFGRPMKARPIPPEHLQIRVAGAAAGAFHGTGEVVARQIADILQAAGRPLQSCRDILDFGCGPGRLVALIRDLHPTARLYGSDIDPEAIGWARAALSDVAQFHVNGGEPPLPFPDRSLDLIYGISVFTHLPEDLQRAWLAELRRVLRPGGILLTTKLNPASYDLPPEIKAQGIDKGYVFWGDAAATDGLPDFYRLAYHTHDYVRREWSRWFDVLHVGSHDLNDTQDAVVLCRRRSIVSRLQEVLARRAA
jgi:SAM-dependent methyltransferase